MEGKRFHLSLTITKRASLYKPIFTHSCFIFNAMHHEILLHTDKTLFFNSFLAIAVMKFFNKRSSFCGKVAGF